MGAGDIGVGLMAWLNIIAIVLLHKKRLPALKIMKFRMRRGWIRTLTRFDWGLKMRITGWKSVKMNLLQIQNRRLLS